jgi:hypothetical protein
MLTMLGEESAGLYRRAVDSFESSPESMPSRVIVSLPIRDVLKHF